MKKAACKAGCRKTFWMVTLVGVAAVVSGGWFWARHFVVGEIERGHALMSSDFKAESMVVSGYPFSVRVTYQKPSMTLSKVLEYLKGHPHFKDKPAMKFLETAELRDVSKLRAEAEELTAEVYLWSPFTAHTEVKDFVLSGIDKSDTDQVKIKNIKATGSVRPNAIDAGSGTFSEMQFTMGTHKIDLASGSASYDPSSGRFQMKLDDFLNTLLQASGEGRVDVKSTVWFDGSTKAKPGTTGIEQLKGALGMTIEDGSITMTFDVDKDAQKAPMEGVQVVDAVIKAQGMAKALKDVDAKVGGKIAPFYDKLLKEAEPFKTADKDEYTAYLHYQEKPMDFQFSPKPIEAKAEVKEAAPQTK